jgi:putative ABC transport system permease protein
MEDVVTATEAPRRFNTAILSAFAGIALLLSLLGIYGTMAYAVTERNREIAIRMAVGASRENVVRNVFASALTLTALGIVIGLALSAVVTRMAASLLFEVKPFDVVVISAAIATLVVSSAMASWFPARRAASVDPMQLLRFE